VLLDSEFMFTQFFPFVRINLQGYPSYATSDLIGGEGDRALQMPIGPEIIIDSQSVWEYPDCENYCVKTVGSQTTALANKMYKINGACYHTVADCSNCLVTPETSLDMVKKTCPGEFVRTCGEKAKDPVNSDRELFRELQTSAISSDEESRNPSLLLDEVRAIEGTKVYEAYNITAESQREIDLDPLFEHNSEDNHFAITNIDGSALKEEESKIFRVEGNKLIVNGETPDN